MASNSQTVSKLLRNLRDNGKFVLQCGSLTYIRSNAEKLEASSTLTGEEYAEICKLVLELSINGDQNTKNEAVKALHAILKYFKKHNLKFFESALLIEREKRLKIFQILEAVDDNSLAIAINDPSAVEFIQDCLSLVQSTSMEWLLPDACTDNLQILETIENKTLSDAEEIEEIIVRDAFNLLRRIYQSTASCFGSQTIEKFDALVMDKAVTLAYMGHKRQRPSAIELLFQAIESNFSERVKTKLANVYSKYKNNVEGPYSTRMMLLVKACDRDWSRLWAISIRILGTDIHRGAGLINKLLSVEERAFKSTDTAVRREAFVSWKLLVDNLALDMKELTSKRRVKLLCVPLTANNSRSEVIALKKLEVWWYLLSKLHQHLVPYADPVVTQFLNFCFGPLGDTPRLSTKIDVIASPGKRFYKTKIIAVDALLQLLVANQNERILMAPILENRLPSSVTDELFKQCYKTFIHSVGEAVVIICKLNDNEMEHKEEICRILWVSLMRYVRATSQEIKKNVYNELILLISEIHLCSLEMEFLNNFLRNTIIPELAGAASDLIYYDATLVDLMTKLMIPAFLKNLQGKQCDAVKTLLWQTVRPETLTNYHPDTLQFLETTLAQLRSIPVDTNSLTDCFELWFAYAEIAFKFMKALQDVNEGTGTETNFKTIDSIISFPFTHMYWANSMQAQKIAVHWKDVYKKYECQADTLASIKPNQVFNNTSKMMEDCLTKNEKCYRIAVYCLDALMATINYKVMLAQSNVPTIVRLVGDLTAITLHEGQPSEAECALRALSSLLITVYGHSPEKVLAYMKVTSQTVELMLKADADDAVVKEITSTWETIVSILRGLSNILDENFLQSYRQVISLSLKHSRAEISSQSIGILDLKDSVKENAKWILEELAQEYKKTSIKDSSKSRVEKNERTPKTTRVAGSFLNRKTTSPRTYSRGKEESEKKLAPLPPEPDSQDYVVIRSEIQLDVDRLTEHQKEIFKKRRDDIPAMYNDLSQSSSQDTQDLQQWFGGKKSVNEQQQKIWSIEEKSAKTNATSTNVDAKIPQVTTKPTTVDAKVPKIDAKSMAVDPKSPRVVLYPKIDQKSSLIDSKIAKVDTKSMAVDTKTPKLIVLCPNIDKKSTGVDVKAPKIVTELAKAGRKCSKPDEKLAATNKVENPIVSLENILETLNVPKAVEPIREPGEKISKARNPPEPISSSAQDPRSESMPPKAASPSRVGDFERDRSEGTSKSRDLSPSSDESYIKETKFSDSSYHSEQESFAKKLNFESLEEYPEEEKNGENEEIQSSNKTSGSRPSGEAVLGPGTLLKPTYLDEVSKKSMRNARKLIAAAQGIERKLDRGTKRKVSSDVENDDNTIEQDKKRRKSSRSPSGLEESTPSQTAKRTENEILRLRIDMVSDGPLRSRRRSKYLDDFVSSEQLGKRTHSPATRGRGSSRGRRSSNPRKIGKSTETEDAATRRRGRPPKSEENGKAERRQENEAGSHARKTSRSTRGRQKKSLQESGAASESQLITDDDETMDDFPSTNNEETSKESTKDSSAILDVLEELAVPENPVLPAAAPTETQMDLDFDEVVESSQDSIVLMASHKRSFAKIVKVTNAHEKSTSEVPVETSIQNQQLAASSPIKTLSAEKKDQSEENIAEDPDETFLDISAIRPQLADDVPVENPEKKTPEASKTTASPVPTKPETSLHFSSPKAHVKRFMKPKSFVPQGRTAHMLGLVTKFEVPEKDETSEKNQADEEVSTMSKFDKLRSIARARAKENEVEAPIPRRANIGRDPERIGSPSGSRQEKIFNNMKSADYAASPPGKMFCNLKNNGEKISPKMEKAQAVSRENNARGNQDEMNISTASEREELPMLEWSSANPPSLTASPSASILKRNRSMINEVEQDPTTPSRAQRKRVSFADPPVSKEMGYEIEAVTSPHKISKYNVSRGLLGRKDSPIRMKQSRFVMIQVDTEKSPKPEEPQILSCDVDVNCARDNELLVRIAEDLEETINYQTPEKIGSPESNSVPGIGAEITAACGTVEMEKIQQEHQETIDTSCAIVKSIPIEETQTQDDLFNSSDEKNDSPKQPANRDNDLLKESFNVSSTSTVESFKLNVTEDSVIGSLTAVRSEETKAIDNGLEDTVDAQNIMTLSLEENLNEQFDDIPVRTSTQRPDPMSEMDTLPVTDSLLNSQPNTMDSQVSTQPLLEISRPELLNATEPIYPTLDNCEQPIDSIIDNLTNPLWRRNLLKYLETRCIRTVGDLARLSEREIVRIPVKGTSKIDFVRKVLKKYESKLHDSKIEKQTNHELGSERPGPETTPQNDVELSDDLRKTLGDISLDTSKIQTDSVDLDTSVLGAQPTNDFLSIDDLNPSQPLARTSTTNPIPTVIIDSTIEPEITMELEVTTELDDTASVSRMKTIDLASDTLPVSVKSVATSTDPPLIATKSVETQIKLEELLDTIDIDVLIKSVVQREGAEKLLTAYKLEMGETSETEMWKKTLKTMGFDKETSLKLACLECGLKKTLCEIPKIFHDMMEIMK